MIATGQRVLVLRAHDSHMAEGLGRAHDSHMAEGLGRAHDSHMAEGLGLKST